MRVVWVLMLTLFASMLYAQTKPPDACTILFAQDVEKVLGTGYQRSPFNGTASDNSVCAYTKDKANVAGITIVVSPDIANGLLQMQKQFAQGGRKITPIEGGGENAFLAEAVNPLTHQPVLTIHFGKGSWHCVMDVKTDGKSNPDAEQKLVKLAYPRLP